MKTKAQTQARKLAVQRQNATDLLARTAKAPLSVGTLNARVVVASWLAGGDVTFNQAHVAMKWLRAVAL